MSDLQAIADRFEIEAQRGAPRRLPAFLAIRSAQVCLSAGSFWNNWTPHLRCRGDPPHFVHARCDQRNIVPLCRPVPWHARHTRNGCRCRDSQ